MVPVGLHPDRAGGEPCCRGGAAAGLEPREAGFAASALAGLGLGEVLQGTGQPVEIALPPESAGEIGYACGMNMFHGTIVVK